MSENSPPSESDLDKTSIGTEEILEKLRQSLLAGGDFPASARLVAQLLSLTSHPKTTAKQVSEVILKEPSLGTRVLALVNSAFYRRAQPIITVTQAVVHIGMKSLADLCAGLILLQKFIPLAREGSIFAACLKKSILTSLLASSISSSITPVDSSDENRELGYLIGTFSELGTLILAYYFPNIVQAAQKRSLSKSTSLSESLSQLTGLSSFRLSMEVLTALELPDFYREVLKSANQISGGLSPLTAESTLPEPSEEPTAVDIAKVLYAAQEISTALSENTDKEVLEKVLERVRKEFRWEDLALEHILGRLPEMFKDHCAALELSLPELPEYLSSFSEDYDEAKKSETDASLESNQVFAQFVKDIREAIEHKESIASIASHVMEALAWGLGFDRVLLLFLEPSKKSLRCRMALGDIENFDSNNFTRPLGEDASPNAPDALAIRESRPVFDGDPILSRGKATVAIPIGLEERVVGLIYADRRSRRRRKVKAQERIAIEELMELLDKAVSYQGSQANWGV